MSEHEMEELKKLLKEALPPMSGKEVRRDQWPDMLKRLAEPRLGVPWWDWVLLAGASIAILLIPGMIPTLLYHL